MSEPKPCPFCGCEGEQVSDGDDGYFIRCSSGHCDAWFGITMRPRDWNARPIEDALCAEIANLHGVIDADDKRLLEAGQRVGIVSGCDNPDIMADEILTLRAEIDRLKAERRWIPVSERLPEEDDPACLFRTSGGGVYFGYRIGDIPCWVAVGIRDFIGLLYDTVTHWMPLPQPPSEEEC